MKKGTVILTIWELGYVRMWSVAKTKEEIRGYANIYATGTEVNLLASWNKMVQNATTLAEVKSTYPGVIGSDVTWFGLRTDAKSICNNSTDLQTKVFGRTI